MPLSDREQRLFAEIGRQLEADDPRFVARTRRRLAAWSPLVRLRFSVVLGAVGLLGVLSLTFELVFGVVGMAALLVAVLVGAGAARERAREQRTGVPHDRL